MKQIKGAGPAVLAGTAFWAVLLVRVAPESAPLLAVFAPIILGTALLGALLRRNS
ncbi:MAG TPA: hypothetical protein VNM14_15520 [Planctomycetota bacterium]|nr:hypothetical protein [Planctomycetota bacterium]